MNYILNKKRMKNIEIFYAQSFKTLDEMKENI